MSGGYTTNFLGYCDTCLCDDDWLCHMHGTQMTKACKGDLVGVTRARQRQSFPRMHTQQFLEV